MENDSTAGIEQRPIHQYYFPDLIRDSKPLTVILEPKDLARATAFWDLCLQVLPPSIYYNEAKLHLLQ
jgi:hypothetical protein